MCFFCDCFFLLTKVLYFRRLSWIYKRQKTFDVFFMGVFLQKKRLLAQVLRSRCMFCFFAAIRAWFLLFPSPFLVSVFRVHGIRYR